MAKKYRSKHLAELKRKHKQKCEISLFASKISKKCKIGKAKLLVAYLTASFLINRTLGFSFNYPGFSSWLYFSRSHPSPTSVGKHFV